MQTLEKLIEFIDGTSMSVVEVEYLELADLKRLRPIHHYDKIWIRQLIEDIQHADI